MSYDGGEDLTDKEFLALLEREVDDYNNQVWRRHIDITNNITYLWQGVVYSSYDDMWYNIKNGDG